MVTPLYSPACVADDYLIYFLIGNLSYSPCSEPSSTVLLLDVMYTMDPLFPTTQLNEIHHPRPLYLYFLYGRDYC